MILVPGSGICLVYVGCEVTPNVKSGMFAALAKNAALGDLDRVNLNPTGLKKFLFVICWDNIGFILSVI